jgi:phosphatidylserine/phosphatidylglycerophosphate/cardiolipin synthase-like enzyme
MRELIDASDELAGMLSPVRIEAIASRVQGGTSSDLRRQASQLVGTSLAQESVRQLADEWDRSLASSDTVFGLLMGAAHARARLQERNSVELVWTGPPSEAAPTRRTDQVLLDVIKRAERELFVISFVAYDVPGVVQALNEAIARQVTVRLLIEASDAHGGTLSVDYASKFKALVPRAQLYIWASPGASYEGGKVHAKVALADDNCAFITSANLTGHAMERNIEAGVLVRGTQVPRMLHAHLNALITMQILRRT